MSKKSADAIVLKNYHLQFILGLIEGPLHGQEARIRNQFLSILKTQLVKVDEERTRIMKEYAEKDDKGEAKIKETGVYDINPDNMVKANKEYLDYLNENYILDVLPSTQPILDGIKKILSETKREMDMRDGALYDEVMTAFDNK